MFKGVWELDWVPGGGREEGKTGWPVWLRDWRYTTGVQFAVSDTGEAEAGGSPDPGNFRPA